MLNYSRPGNIAWEVSKEGHHSQRTWWPLLVDKVFFYPDIRRSPMRQALIATNVLLTLVPDPLRRLATWQRVCPGDCLALPTGIEPVFQP
jgi:hypothetical protein